MDMVMTIPTITGIAMHMSIDDQFSHRKIQTVSINNEKILFYILFWI